MANVFGDLITNLNSLGFYDFVLPFLLVFAIIYGLLVKAKVFGDNSQRVAGLLGIIIAFFVASFYGPSMATFFTNLFGGATYVLAFILIAVLFFAMSGFKAEGFVPSGKNWPVWLFLIVLAIIVFMVATGTTIGGVAINESAMGLIFVVIVLLLAVWFVVKEPGSSKQAGEK